MADDLTARIHNLPPELFRQIRDEVLSYERMTTTSRYVQVTSAYRFPNLLQVDSTSRNRLVRCYYADTVFILANEVVAVEFISALDGTFLGLIEGLRIIHDPQSKLFLKAASSLVSRFLGEAKKHGIDYNYSVCPSKILADRGEPFVPLSSRHAIVVLRRTRIRLFN